MAHTHPIFNKVVFTKRVKQLVGGARFVTLLVRLQTAKPVSAYKYNKAIVKLWALALSFLLALNSLQPLHPLSL